MYLNSGGNMSPKTQASTTALHGTTFQKTVIFIIITKRTTNLTQIFTFTLIIELVKGQEKIDIIPQAIRSWVRDPMSKLRFSIYVILKAALTLSPGVHSASNRNEYQKRKNNISGE
jgi:hypothetical protein